MYRREREQNEVLEGASRQVAGHSPGIQSGPGTALEISSQDKAWYIIRRRDRDVILVIKFVHNGEYFGQQLRRRIYRSSPRGLLEAPVH